MILERLIDLICDEFGLSEGDIGEDTLLEEFVSDEFEMQEMIDAVESEFGISLHEMPADDWSIGDLAGAIAGAD
ncbi:MAG: hypothetical protein K6F64_08900 [Clostridia bacterium]|nr:hypothetical protein [Clostridia bacterium]